MDRACRGTLELENVPKVWSDNEADLFARLALYYPQVLDHDQERIWAFIRQRPEFWLLSPYTANYQDEDPEHFNFPLLRDSWNLIQAHVLHAQPFDEAAFADIKEKLPGKLLSEYAKQAGGAWDTAIDKFKKAAQEQDAPAAKETTTGE